MPSFIKGLFSYWALKDTASCLEQFSKQNPMVGVERSMNQAIERIQINAEWFERDGELIQSYLKKYVQAVRV